MVNPGISLVFRTYLYLHDLPSIKLRFSMAIFVLQANEKQTKILLSLGVLSWQQDRTFTVYAYIHIRQSQVGNVYRQQLILLDFYVRCNRSNFTYQMEYVLRKLNIAANKENFSNFILSERNVSRQSRRKMSNKIFSKADWNNWFSLEKTALR